jgi:hypothetical protein
VGCAHLGLVSHGLIDVVRLVLDNQLVWAAPIYRIVYITRYTNVYTGTYVNREKGSIVSTEVEPTFPMLRWMSRRPLRTERRVQWETDCRRSTTTPTASAFFLFLLESVEAQSQEMGTRHLEANDKGKGGTRTTGKVIGMYLFFKKEKALSLSLCFSIALSRLHWAGPFTARDGDLVLRCWSTRGIVDLLGSRLHDPEKREIHVATRHLQHSRHPLDAFRIQTNCFVINSKRHQKRTYRVRI